MARRCLCARLLAAVQDDPRLRTLPLSARMLFLLVAEAAARSPVFGVLPFAETSRVSLLVSASETEVETQMETLRREGLIASGEGGGLLVPLLAEAPPRTEAARRNGAAGGRPRKGETAEAARLRRSQSAMLLPIRGGETQETQAAKSVSTTTTVKLVSQSVSGLEGESSARGDADAWVSLGDELVEIVGLDPARGTFDFRIVREWMQEGRSAETIRAAVTRVVARPSFRREAVRSLGYFSQAVREQSAVGVVRSVMRDTEEEARLIAAAERDMARRIAGQSVAAA